MTTRQRPADRLREISFTPHFLRHPEGSVLVRAGDTVVLCTASVEDKVKDWLRGRGQGWVTAEYAMLPRATHTRNQREGQGGRWPSPRSQEIQRFIGRCLRGVVWPKRLGERTVTIDCDVLQADGGTRTAAVTGGLVALVLALHRLVDEGRIPSPPLKGLLAAVSVGLVDGEALLDLDYADDSRAEVDLNLAADERGEIIEIQATAERRGFPGERLQEMTALALAGCAELVALQRRTLLAAGVSWERLFEPDGRTA